MRKRGYRIPLNKIQGYYIERGKSKAKNERKRRKGCRYERKHSGSLLHGDWHRSDENKKYAIVWLDDASRKILACSEFESATAEHSTQGRSWHTVLFQQRWQISVPELSGDSGNKACCIRKEQSTDERQDGEVLA